MEYILNVLVNSLALLSLIVPCYVLSVFYARKEKPLIGGALALAKLLLMVRATQIWEWMLISSGKTGWQLFGFGYSPISAIFFMSMLAIGVICIVLNICVFFKQVMIPAAQA